MKHIKFSIILLIMALLSVTAGITLAGGAITGTINTATCSADATKITVNYTITNHTSENLDIFINGFSNTDLPDQNGVQQIILDLPLAAQGIAVILDLGFVFTSLDARSITCTPLPVVPVSEDPFVPPVVSYLFNDGRLEPFASDYVVYPDPNDGIIVYTPEGLPILNIPLATIGMLGIPDDEPRLLGESADGQAQVFRLNDGRYQVVLGPDAEGKFHTAIWTGLGNISPANIETDTF